MAENRVYFVKVPKIVRKAYKSLIWDIPGFNKNIYLTFDDGPDQDVTPDVLEILRRYRAKASFFCLGSKAAHQEKFLSEIRSEGHCLGNHSFSHPDGWKTPAEDYINDIKKADGILQTNLFRPPYGKITRKQIAFLRPEYKIVMWSLMPGDFDPVVSKETVVRRAIRNTENGTIIVFHDDIRFREKLLFALEHYLRHFTGKGFQFNGLESAFV
jgi:peptidoglycan-N-acetylglucosamine deacetylase